MSSAHDAAIETTLGPWGGIVLIIAGFFILAMCAGLVIYLYRNSCCRSPAALNDAEKGAEAEYNSKKKTSLNATFTGIDGDLPLGDVSYWSWARGSMYDATSLEGDPSDALVRGASIRDSTYSSMSDQTDTSSLTTVSSGRDSVEGDKPVEGSFGQALPPAGPKPMLSLRIQFKQESNELTITAHGVRFLPNRDYGTSPSPQLYVVLEKTRWPSMFRKPQLIEQLSTSSVRRTRNPHWEHTFRLDVTAKELRDWQAHFQINDDCKLQGSRIIGQVVIVLRRYVDQLMAGDPLQLQLPLAPREQQKGFLLFGLSYLPTAQRMAITVVQGVRLRWQLVAATLQEFRPYVRAAVVSPAYGKTICKNCLEPKQGQENVDFSGTMKLDMTTSDLSTASLVIAVCFRPKGDPGKEKPKSRVLGSVCVGTRVATSRGREHWWAVAHCPRRVVSIWHSLR